MLKRAVSRWALRLCGPFGWGCQKDGDSVGVIFGGLPGIHSVSTGRADVDDVLYAVMVKWAEMMVVTHAHAISNSSALARSGGRGHTGRREGTGTGTVTVREGSSNNSSSGSGSSMYNRDIGRATIEAAASVGAAGETERRVSLTGKDTASTSSSTFISSPATPFSSSYLDRFVSTAYGAVGDYTYPNRPISCILYPVSSSSLPPLTPSLSFSFSIFCPSLPPISCPSHPLP